MRLYLDFVTSDYIWFFIKLDKMAKHFTLEDVQAAVEDAITGGEYSIPKVAASLHTSERTFYRRVRELTGATPKAVISDIQMKRCASELHPKS